MQTRHEKYPPFFAGTATVRHVALDIPELRSDDVAVIAREKARYAFGVLHEPLIVDDTAFAIDALHGFPGPYAAYVLKAIGNQGILRLMAGHRRPRRWLHYRDRIRGQYRTLRFFRHHPRHDHHRTPGLCRVRV